jgi:hypothetical protein
VSGGGCEKKFHYLDIGVADHQGHPVLARSLLKAISFPIEFDVWGRLCTHFEAAKVMTFAPFTQHFLVSPFVKKQNWKNFFLFSERRSRKDREREQRDTDFAQYSRKQE